MVVTALCASMLGASGCFFAGYGPDRWIYNYPDSDLRLGEWARDGNTPWGPTVIAVFYKDDSGFANNLNTSKAMLDLFRSNNRRYPNRHDAAFITLFHIWRGHCQRMSEDTLDRLICDRATHYRERGEFLEALEEYASNPSRCIAYRFSIPAENPEIVSRWGTVPHSYRMESRYRCIPN